MLFFSVDIEQVSQYQQFNKTHLSFKNFKQGLVLILHLRDRCNNYAVPVSPFADFLISC